MTKFAEIPSFNFLQEIKLNSLFKISSVYLIKIIFKSQTNYSWILHVLKSIHFIFYEKYQALTCSYITFITLIITFYILPYLLI